MKKALISVFIFFVIGTITVGALNYQSIDSLFTKSSSTGIPEEKFETKKVELSYSNLIGGDVSGSFLYNDGMLLNDSRALSTDLAKVSSYLSSAEYNTGYINRAFDQMGYTYEHFNTREYTLNDNDFVRFAIAKKVVNYNDSDYIFYCLVVKGTGGDYDWYSNFNLGTSGEMHPKS